MYSQRSLLGTLSSSTACASLSFLFIFSTPCQNLHVFFLFISPSLSLSAQRAPCFWRQTWKTLSTVLCLTLSVWRWSERAEGWLEVLQNHYVQWPSWVSNTSNWAIAAENEETWLPCLPNVPFITFCLVVFSIFHCFFLKVILATIFLIISYLFWFH